MGDKVEIKNLNILKKVTIRLSTIFSTIILLKKEVKQNNTDETGYVLE